MGQIITGTDVLLYINGRRFSRVFSFDFDSSTPSKEIIGVDVTSVIELAPTISRCGGSIGLYRLRGDGGLEGAGISPPVQELPRGKYASIMLVDRITDTVIFSALNCHIEDQKWSIKTKSLMVGSAVFKALTWNNEVKPFK